MEGTNDIDFNEGIEKFIVLLYSEMLPDGG